MVIKSKSINYFLGQVELVCGQLPSESCLSCSSLQNTMGVLLLVLRTSQNFTVVPAKVCFSATYKQDCQGACAWCAAWVAVQFLLSRTMTVSSFVDLFELFVAFICNSIYRRRSTCYRKVFISCSARLRLHDRPRLDPSARANLNRFWCDALSTVWYGWTQDWIFGQSNSTRFLACTRSLVCRGLFSKRGKHGRYPSPILELW